MNRNNLLVYVVFFALFATIVMNVGLLFYGVAHDEIFYTMYNTGETLKNQSIISQQFLDATEDFIELSDLIPTVLDLLFLLSFLTLVSTVWIGSYFARREGIFSVIGISVIGTLFLMFVGTIILNVSEYINDIIKNRIMSAVALSTPFYNFYIDNNGIINLLIILVAILINFVDLDFAKFNTQKEKENQEII